MTNIPMTLKWNKQTFPLFIQKGETAIFPHKERIQTLTSVPTERQKLLSKKRMERHVKR